MGVYCCNICDNQIFKASSETSAPEGGGENLTYKYFNNYIVDSCNFNKEFQFGILSVIINCKGCYEQIGEITTKDGDDIYSITVDSIKLVESASEDNYETTSEYQLTEKVDEELRERYRKVFDMKSASTLESGETTTTTTTTTESAQQPPQPPQTRASSNKQGKSSSMKKPTSRSAASKQQKQKKRVRINEAGAEEEVEEEEEESRKIIGVDAIFFSTLGLLGFLHSSISVAKYIIKNYY